ncbi:MAG TPA: AraC family transcriptional regulator [Clostridia bacterium]|nr:AraC family transcriptional regulator [Clostridia bacterium]
MYDRTALQNIQPHFTHIVNRICTPSWEIEKGKIKTNNIMFIYDGQGSFYRNGESFSGSKGHLIHYKPGDLRFANTSSDSPMKCYAIDFIYTSPLFKDDKWELYTPNLPFDYIQKIDDSYVVMKLTSLFDILANTWVSGNRNKTSICRTIFIDILTLIMDWKCGYSFDQVKIKRVEKVIQYLSENYQERITLEMLSKVADISVSYLGSIFKEITGTSPIDYLMDIRMLRAKTLLLDGVPVSKTADLTGFNDLYYFSKYFKKREGVSPTQYYHKNSGS